MRPCDEYAALLDLYVDGELSPGEMTAVQEHLEVCPGCRSYVDDALAIRAAFPDAEETEVPDGFAESICAVIQANTAPRRNRRSRWMKTLLPMAACCAIVVLLSRLPITLKEPAEEIAPATVTDTADTAEEAEDSAAEDSGAALYSSTQGSDTSNDAAAFTPETTSELPDQRLADTAPKLNTFTSTVPQESSPSPDMSTVPAAQSFGMDGSESTTGEGTAGKNAASESDTVAEEDSAVQDPDFFATLILTPEQAGSALEELPEEIPVSSDPGTGGTVYWLTAEQFDALLTQLDQPAYTREGEGELAKVILLPQ